VAFKALFIIPSQRLVYGISIHPSYAHLGVLYVSACLEKEGVEVRIIDVDVDGYNTNMIIEEIGGFRPDIVGLTATTPVINDCMNMAGIIKEHYDIPVILGGIHATLNPIECIKRNNIDFVIVGEGERTAVELVDKMRSGKKDFDSIKGLAFRKNGQGHFTGDRELICDLDSLPFPSRHLLKNFSKYKPPDAEHLPVASIMTTRGCPGRCSYCCTKNIFRDRYRAHSIDYVLREIAYVKERFDVREIHIADDAFNVNKKRTLEFCRAVKRENFGIHFEFLNGLRADVIDQEILSAFKEIGIGNVGFGAESASRKILRNVHKNIMPEKVRDAVGLSKKNGFKTWVFFMIGLPGETECSIRRTIAFARTLDPDFVKFLIFKPFPGTQIYNEMMDRGLIDDLNLDNYGVYTPPVHHLDTLTKEDLLRWQQKAFRIFYFRPSKIWQHLKRQKSMTQVALSLRGLKFVAYNAFKKERS